MTRRVFLLLTMVVLAIFGSTPPPPPPAPPAVELHRTADAAFFDPSERSILFVLVIGSDVREGDPRAGRADTLQLIAVDVKKNRGTIVGIPRDSYVPIPGSGPDKINASLFFGGPERTVATVKQLAGVPIHYWALVEFSRFRRLVDALGGVRVSVPYAMSDPASGAFFPAGPRNMNGTDALAFARARKTVPGGDFGRSANQGRLLIAALKKFATDATSPIKLAKYLTTFDDLVESDVPAREMLELAGIGRRLDASKFASVVLPGAGGTAGGSSVVNLTAGAHEIFKKIRDDAVL